MSKCAKTRSALEVQSTQIVKGDKTMKTEIKGYEVKVGMTDYDAQDVIGLHVEKTYRFGPLEEASAREVATLEMRIHEIMNDSKHVVLTKLETGIVETRLLRS